MVWIIDNSMNEFEWLHLLGWNMKNSHKTRAKIETNYDWPLLSTLWNYFGFFILLFDFGECFWETGHWIQRDDIFFCKFFFGFSILFLQILIFVFRFSISFLQNLFLASASGKLDIEFSGMIFFFANFFLDFRYCFCKF